MHIALVGPMTGRNPENGRSFVEGIRLYLDRVNNRGGVHGHKVVLTSHSMGAVVVHYFLAWVTNPVSKGGGGGGKNRVRR